MENQVENTTQSAVTVPIDRDVEDRINQALALINSGALDQAKDRIDDLVAEHSDYYSVIYAQGILLLKQGQLDTGIDYLEQAVKKNPLLIEAYYNLAVAHRDRSDFVDMIKHYRMVVDLDRTDSRMAEESRKFLTDLQKAIRENHGVDLDRYLQARSYFNDGFRHLKMEQPDRAIPKFQASIALVDNLPQSHGNLGLCFAQQGRRSDALAAFSRALEIDPKYEAAMNNKSIVECLREGEKLRIRNVRSGKGAERDDDRSEPSEKKSLFSGLVNWLFH